MVMHPCNRSPQDAEAGELIVLGLLGLYIEFQSSQNYTVELSQNKTLNRYQAHFDSLFLHGKGSRVST